MPSIFFHRKQILNYIIEGIFVIMFYIKMFMFMWPERRLTQLPCSVFYLSRREGRDGLHPCNPTYLSPTLFQKPIFRTLPTSPIFNVRERGRLVGVVVKAVGENPDSSTSIVKYVQKAWDNFEDRLALAGLGFSAIVAVWASGNLIMAIDKLPIVPSVFEFIGILFSWWFVYRYLLFKPDREELLKTIKGAAADVLDL